MTGGQAGRLRHPEHVMGTVVSFDVPSWARGPLGEAVRWLHWVDGTFSPYLPDSDVSRLGAGEVSLAQCAPEVRQALGAVLYALVQLGIAQGDVERAVARRVPLQSFEPGTPSRTLVDALLEPNARPNLPR